MAETNNIAKILAEHGEREPSRPAYTWLAGEDGGVTTSSFGELHALACGVAARLSERGAAGERVVLVYPDGLEFIAGFFGCLYAGAIPVPAFPPRGRRGLHRIRAIAADSRARYAMTTAAGLSRLAAGPLDAAGGLAWLASDEATGGDAAGWALNVEASNGVAFVQYTSGSTSEPKGVLVSHENLIANQRMIQSTFHTTKDSVVTGWLPLFHDMGLIGNVMQALYAGAHCVLLSPVSFLQAPVSWLRAISAFGGTISGGPDFGYVHCVRKVRDEDLEGLDLSRWEMAYNGSEPVRRETIESFCGRFAQAGFRRSAFAPCYGLAEATLLVAVDHPWASPRGTDATAEDRPSVSCGRPAPGQSVRIVDPETRTVKADGDVGEIWVSGANVAQGYWGKPEQTRETFAARLADGSGPYLRTGDLGFLRAGELHVSGRIKDLIILRGANYYPQDFERAVQAARATFRPGCGAAFTLPGVDGAQLAIAQEIDPNDPDLDQAIDNLREAVSQDYGVAVAVAALLKPGGIPKTSSGKVRRHACAALLADGSEVVLRFWRRDGADAPEKARRQEADEASASLRERWLRDRVAKELRIDVERVPADRSLPSLGVDSIQAAEIAHDMERELGARASLLDLLSDSSIAELARRTFGGELTPAGGVADPSPAQGPLSQLQESLFFEHRADPLSPRLNVARAATFRGDFDERAMRLAWESVAAKRPALRARFELAHDGPSQRISPVPEVPFEVWDARTMDDAALEAEMLRQARRPFDLAAAPPFRVALFRCADQRWRMLLAVHHIVCDFESLTLLLDDLEKAYAAARRGEPLDRAPGDDGYMHCVLAQREDASEEQTERLMRLCREELAGAHAELRLPGEASGAAERRGESAAAKRSLSGPTFERLRAFAARRQLTVAAALTTVLHALLQRYAGRADFSTGFMVSLRDRGERRRTVGYWVNPTPLPADLRPGSSLAEAAERTRDAMLRAFERAALPIQAAAKAMREGSRDRGPLFRVMFTHQAAAGDRDRGLAAVAAGFDAAETSFADLSVRLEAFDGNIAPYDLTLTSAAIGKRLLLALAGDASLFDERVVAATLDDFVAVLEALVERPEQPLEGLAIPSLRSAPPRPASPARKRRIAPQATLAGELERVAAERGDAEAITGEDGERLSYLELLERSGRLAGRLRELGAGPEQRVAVLLERGPQLVTALAAVSRAGAAYVPLDPGQPAERLRWMLADSGAQTLLTTGALAQRSGASATTTLLLDEQDQAQWPELAAGEAERAGLSADNLAYVIYTSGSSGRPKGCLVTHRNVLRLMRATEREYGFGAKDVWLMLHSAAFDFSVWEMWGALLYGGRLVTPSHWTVRTPEALYELAAREGVTVLNQTPSYFRQWKRAEERAKERGERLAESVRLVVFGGEELKPSLVKGWREGERRPRLVNMYGITETTVHVTLREMSGEEEKSVIGEALEDLEIELLDERGERVAEGERGEIYVGGAGLARGYHGRGGLTAERFVPHRWSERAGERLYRTGDAGRYDERGELEYLGRLDGQVQIRGHRVELGEIEAALQRIEGVEQAAARVVEDGEGEPRIAAYVAARAGAGLDAERLRRELSERLPDYMIPSSFT
ncbi:MAG: amino acid adenylation domain-containing protein, partial [Acidobacteria bacterium]|nr:amino acid adenylation domain-containing protein [Acidobacteriota bacterium]